MISQIDFSNLIQSFTKFPKFKHLQPYEVILEPGDILYLPPYWFHHVEVNEGFFS